MWQWRSGCKHDRVKSDGDGIAAPDIWRVEEDSFQILLTNRLWSIALQEGYVANLLSCATVKTIIGTCPQLQRISNFLIPSNLLCLLVSLVLLLCLCQRPEAPCLKRAVCLCCCVKESPGKVRGIHQRLMLY